MSLFEIADLSKVYPDGTEALRGLSFNISEGEFLAIVGISGSGKSTLLHILGFLDRQTEGEFRFEGKSITDYSPVELAHIRNKKFGFIFQSFHLLPRSTVFENVRLPLIYSDLPDDQWSARVGEVVKSVGLGHRLNYKVSKLSGGERQRVAIARALVNNPRVIFADEPTGNLDSKSGQTVMEIIQRLSEEEGRTVILITHETYTAEHAERIVEVYDGKIKRDERVNHRHQAREHFVK